MLISNFIFILNRGFNYPPNMKPILDWRRINTNNTWTPITSRKMSELICDFAKNKNYDQKTIINKNI